MPILKNPGFLSWQFLPLYLVSGFWTTWLTEGILYLSQSMVGTFGISWLTGSCDICSLNFLRNFWGCFKAISLAPSKCSTSCTAWKQKNHVLWLLSNINSVVEFKRLWVLKSKIFGQNQYTQRKQTIVFWEYGDCQFVNNWAWF